MSNTYTWIIDSLDVTPSLEGQTNVVSCVHYRVNANNGTEPNSHTATIWGTQMLNYTVESPFTDYSALTKDIVINWVQSALGVEQVTSIQANLDTQIENLVNHPVISPRLPWLPVFN
jgi:hypothetical protein